MDHPNALPSAQIAQRVLSSLIAGFHKNAYDMTAAFFERISGTACLLHPDGAIRIGAGAFVNAVYDKKVQITFFDLGTDQAELLMCFLEMMHHADFSDPEVLPWRPLKLGDPEFVETRAKTYIDHGHGLFLSPPGPGGGRFLVSQSYAWTPVERRVFGNYAELHHLL